MDPTASPQLGAKLPRRSPLRTGSSATIPSISTASSLLSPPREEEDDAFPDESTHINSSYNERSYGTLPSRPPKSPTSLRRRPLSQLPFLRSIRQRSVDSVNTIRASPRFRDFTLGRISSRPISSYDQPLPEEEGDVTESDAKTNGIRVWYSSYTSIDWLHDAIQDSLRFSRLRRRKSLRSRVRLAFDKSLGWIIVTIVGFLSAVVAFLVIRGEQWLFDLKDGYCEASWLKSKRTCCPHLDQGEVTFYRRVEESCAAWISWPELFLHDHTANEETGFVGYISYTFAALTLATTSCLLTLYLTKSTTFVTRKESTTSIPATESKLDAKYAEPKRKVLYYAAGSGIPEIKTILSGFVIHGYLGGRTLFTKSVGLAFSVASGLSLGKEGPFVHIASCVGNIISRISNKYENNEAKRREILSAACAAGVAVAFGAPIGGTLFSLEEVSYYFPPKVMWRSFFCAMIAAITLKMLDPFGTGKLVLLQVTYDKDWHAWELIPFFLISLFGGVYGAYFSKLNYRWSKHVRNKTFLGTHPLMEVLLITFITSLLSFANPYTRMGGTELVYNLFAECRTGSGNNHSGLCIIDPGSFEAVWKVARSILIAMVVKGGLTIVTFGIKLPAGIFIPTLGVGACAGRLVGIAVRYLQLRYPEFGEFTQCGGNVDCIIPGLYAMVGAAAALSGVTRTTVSLAVIMFELTDTLTYAVPVMLSVLVAKTVADALEPKGIYDLCIELSELPYLDTKHEYLWGSVTVSDVMHRDVESIRLEEKNTVQSLRSKLLHKTKSGLDDIGFPILRRVMYEGGSRMIGYIGYNELDHALSLVPEDTNEDVIFHETSSHYLASSSISSLQDLTASQVLVRRDPFDFSPYMDQAPLTMANNSPMELVHQIFAKLGARYVVITDTDGLYEGVIDKKRWLAFLSELEEK